MAFVLVYCVQNTVSPILYQALPVEECVVCTAADEERVRRLKLESYELGIADNVIFKTNVCTQARLSGKPLLGGCKDEHGWTDEKPSPSVAIFCLSILPLNRVQYAFHTVSGAGDL